MPKTKTIKNSKQHSQGIPSDADLLKICEVFDVDDDSEMDRIVSGKVGEVDLDQWGD